MKMTITDWRSKLFESEGPSVLDARIEPDFKQVVEEKCQPFLKAAGIDTSKPVRDWPVLYRGSDRFINVPYKIVPVRTDRRPRDTPKETHHKFNDIIAKAGGVANRTNSIFTSGDPSAASGYGDHLYLVFPVGNFHYTYATGIHDWTGALNPLFSPPYILPISDKKVERALNELLDLQELPWSDIVAPMVGHLRDHSTVIARHHVLSLASHELIPTSISHESRELLVAAWKQHRYFWDRPEALIGDLIAPRIRADDGSLKQAIKSGVEIMIHCNEVILVENEDD